jgi:RNA 3'-terminal phosphate cyclase
MVQIESVDIGGLPVTARTNAEVIEQFLPVGFRIEEQDGFAKVGVRH